MKQIISAGIGFGISIPLISLMGVKPTLPGLILALIGLTAAFIANLLRE